MLLKAFGCAESVSIAADEYDNLFVVVPKARAARRSAAAEVLTGPGAPLTSPTGLPLFCSSSHFCSGAK